MKSYHSNIELSQVQRAVQEDSESEIVGKCSPFLPFIRLTSFIEKLSYQHISNMLSTINKHGQSSHLLFLFFVYFVIKKSLPMLRLIEWDLKKNVSLGKKITFILFIDRKDFRQKKEKKNIKRKTTKHPESSFSRWLTFICP